MARTRLPKKPAEGHVDKKKRIMVPSEDSMDQQTPPGVESSTPVDTVEDKMQIYFRLMKTVPIEVKKSDTIQNVRTEFSKLEGISMVNLKSLSFAGDWLQNEQKVVDYDIKNGSIISVFLDSGFRTKIHVKMLQTGKPITLDVDMRDTVLTIKRRIQNKEGVSVGQQYLFHLGEELDDGRTISSYNIEGGSTVYAVFREGDTMQISVSLGQNRRTFRLKSKSWYTILNVKFLIESMVGIPVNKQKIYLDQVMLVDHITLADIHITEGRTLNLINGMCIFVTMPTFTTKIFEVDGSHTIKNLSEMIEEREGIHIDKQVIHFNGKRLQLSDTLTDYGIENEDTLNLMLRMCGC